MTGLRVKSTTTSGATFEFNYPAANPKCNGYSSTWYSFEYGMGFDPDIYTYSHRDAVDANSAGYIAPTISWPSDWPEGATKSISVRAYSWWSGSNVASCNGQENGGLGPVSRISVTRPRTFAASSAYDKADDSFTISGRTVASSSQIQVSADNGNTWETVGNASSYKYEFKLDRKYTSGTSIRLREGSSGTGSPVTLHSAALTDVSVRRDGPKRTLTAKATANGEVHVSKSDVAADDYQVIKAGADGWIRGAELDKVPGTANTATMWIGDKGVRTEVNLPLTLGANAIDVNVEKGTANLEGFVPEGTNLLQVEWGSKTKTVTEFTDGMFQQALDDLALGSNPVKITALKGATQLGTFSLDVDLKVEDVTAKATFDKENVERTVELRGTATPGAKIEVRRGMNVEATETVGADGSWSGTVNPPNMTGVDTLDVVQVIRGQDNGAMELPVNYGIGTTITSPADDFVLQPGNDLVLKGVSQQNSLLRVFEKDNKGTILGSTTADPDDGGWAIPVRGLEDREYELVVATTSIGYNLTTTEITINPGKSVELDPATVTTESVKPGTTNTIEGSATPGSSLRIQNKWGTDLLGEDVPVDNNGRWSFDRVISASATNFAFKIVQTKGSLTTTSELFTVTADDPAASLVDPTVTAPTEVALGVNNTFTGTATPGASLKIVNASGTDLLGHPVTVNGNGDWTFDRVVSWNAKNFTFFIEQTKNGATKKTGPYVINPADPAASLVDPTVTAPTEVALGVNNTFTGTATPGASLKIVNASGTDLLGHPVTVNGNGDWTFDRVVSWNAKNFTFFIEQTKNGATKKTGPYVINPVSS
ncbi:hypothetical protein [Curtobacterium sp. TXMA1]|uniref:hypothetical protein n=1 Tax=Curtobacterium sp. TXMA1 TaxID=2876939 RepID=UPI001CCC02E4|nr:hypothetical protein [Curtobacterium sp. TXMA1]UBQ03022.1 hypothetical protein LCG91_02305 [Curtobacterium sp. TXMA1]